MTNRIPTMLFQHQISEYFSLDIAGLINIWGTNNHTKVRGDNDKWYEAKYDHDSWGNGVIRLKRCNAPKW